VISDSGTGLRGTITDFLCYVLRPGLYLYFSATIALVVVQLSDAQSGRVLSGSENPVTSQAEAATGTPGDSIQTPDPQSGAEGISVESVSSKQNQSFFGKFIPISLLVAPNNYARILMNNLQVYENNRSNSPVLGIARQGSFYRLESVGESWCLIRYKGKRGWLKRSDRIEIIAASFPEVFIVEYKHTFILLAICIPAVLLLIFLMRKFRNNLSFHQESGQAANKRIFIISKNEVSVQGYLTGNKKPMNVFLTEIGFEITTVMDIHEFEGLINHHIPDVILVDWLSDTYIQQSLEKILVSKSTTSNILVLFFNVPDISLIQRSVTLPNTQYITGTFSDRDIFNIISPFVITGEKRHFIRKSVEISALQGDVALSNMTDVFQFIEIGKKTGCLLILEEKPIGIVYFDEGRIIYAVSQNATAEKAIFEILSLKKGQFNFISEKKPKEPNCSISTLNVLMEWSKVTDETSGNRLR
jgi:hypothetical protein